MPTQVREKKMPIDRHQSIVDKSEDFRVYFMAECMKLSRQGRLSEIVTQYQPRCSIEVSMLKAS